MDATACRPHITNMGSNDLKVTLSTANDVDHITIAVRSAARAFSNDVFIKLYRGYSLPVVHSFKRYFCGFTFFGL